MYNGIESNRYDASHRRPVQQFQRHGMHARSPGRWRSLGPERSIRTDRGNNLMAGGPQMAHQPHPDETVGPGYEHAH
jgi:hypothetical protein